MELTQEQKNQIDSKLNFLETKLNMPPIGKYTIPEDVYVVLKNDLFNRYSILILANSMMRHMRLPYEPIDLNINVDRSLNRNVSYRPTGEYVYYGVSGKNQINLTLVPEDTPESVCALLSHEMSHHYLYGKHIMTEPELENEILTDIGGVYFGFAMYMLPRYAENVSPVLSFSQIRKLMNSVPTIGYINKSQMKYAMRRCDEIRRRYRDMNR